MLFSQRQTSEASRSVQDEKGLSGMRMDYFALGTTDLSSSHADPLHCRVTTRGNLIPSIGNDGINCSPLQRIITGRSTLQIRRQLRANGEIVHSGRAMPAARGRCNVFINGSWPDLIMWSLSRAFHSVFDSQVERWTHRASTAERRHCIVVASSQLHDLLVSVPDKKGVSRSMNRTKAKASD